VGPQVAAVACLLAVAVAGCGTGERADDAAAVVERFHAALEAGDGQAACEELSEETASKLEQQEKKPCEEAIIGLELPKGGRAADTRVEITSAIATLADGGSDFLDEGPDGWKIAAAGCTPTLPDQPYECELEG
jgi:uncharacterized NAD-dependent epimerase/dehydratase family protein